MSITRILIGPFRRRVFARGLRALLAEETGYVVSELEDGDDIEAHLSAAHPTVLILERRSDSDPEPYRPRSPAVAVILVSQEGADAQIALNQLDPSRLRTAIALAEGATHPKMVELAANRPDQPACIVPQFRNAAQSAIAPVVRWLDIALALELSRYLGTAGIGEDAARLIEALVGDAPVLPSEETRAFDAMTSAPLWQQRPLRSLALDPLELRLICLTAAPDLDQRYGQAIGLLQNDYAQPRPNASTLARLLDRNLIGADIEAMVSCRRLFARFALIRAVDDAAPDRPQPGYRLAAPILELILGHARRAGRHWQVIAGAAPPQAALVEQVRSIRASVANPVFVVPPGTHDGAGELTAALVAADCPVLRVDPDGLSGRSRAEAEARLNGFALRARLHGAVLMIDGADRLDTAARDAVGAADLEGMVGGLALVGAFSAPQSASEAFALYIDRPDPGLLARRWQAAARDHGLSIDDCDARSLAARLRLTLSEISAVARLAEGRRRSGPADSDSECLSDAARHVSLAHAPRTVRRPPCRYDWSDIVLPASIAAQIRSVPQQVLDGPKVLDEWGYAARLSYGRGVGALFSGPSGTGKTMSAQIIARELGVDLMQVELSRCVSKYIGETEKNIDACFAAAESASAVLLFDEADALFGKRTEIKDAHDRHANVEVAYLLQRIEAFEGLVILTSNFKTNIDAAFLRRLRFVIDFPMPDAEERVAIWSRAIPEDAPRAKDLDLAFLARRLELSGGSIQQIAVNAAFAAARDDAAISMHHVLAATRAELLKMGMLAAERDLPELSPVALDTAMIGERAI